MPVIYNYLYPLLWPLASSDWRPSTRPPTPDAITIYDSAGTPLSAAVMSSLTLTLYDPSLPSHPIINGIDAVNILNDGQRGTLSNQGLFGLKLLPADTAISAAHDAEATPYEYRDALVAWVASQNRAGALLFHFCIRKRPVTTP